MKNKIGIAISTRNREHAFNASYGNIVKYLPDGASIVVVDDASDIPCEVSNYRFKDQVGISTVKNKCLSLLYDLGCEHFFLFDSDTYPIIQNWHLPYIQNEHDHLCYTFLHANKVDGNIKYHNLANGCMMYIRRNVIDKIGGFDTNLYNKYEHVQFSYRAYSCGLIPHPFMDAVGSNELIYCMDQDKSVQRTMDKYEMAMQINNNREYYYKTRMLTDFIPFK